MTRAKIAWWFLNAEIGPWGSRTPLRFWTWRFRGPKP